MNNLTVLFAGPVRRRDDGQPPAADWTDTLAVCMSEPTPMSVPSELVVLAEAYPELIAGLRDARVAGEASPLSERDIELIRLGVMIAIDAPAASFDAHVRRALGAGANRDEVIGVAACIATIVGMPRILSGLPKLMAAMEGNELGP